MPEETIEIKDGITAPQKRDLMRLTNTMKDVINHKEFAAIMVIYQRAINRIEKESGQKI